MEGTYSYTEIFTKPIEIDNDKSVQVNKIVIPKIQRPYAQGRTGGKYDYVRKTLLTDLFSSLAPDGKIIELNFVYGIIKHNEIENILELLDGQQRMTTLFLLHWYIANRELGEGDETDRQIRDCLSKFVYETRSTSTVFCSKLSHFHYDVTSTPPSEAIRKSKWYFKSFDRDSTICAMLTMLDSIHEFYNRQDSRDLHKRLDNIRFYVKSLNYFHLSDELYIKMNARGLQLSTFENFKADLTSYVSSSPEESFKEKVPLYSESLSSDTVEFNLNFSIKLDAKWVDMFWKSGSEDFDESYMSFFTRFFTCMYIIDTMGTVSDRDMRTDSAVNTLYTTAENRRGFDEYMGFDLFRSILEHHPEHIHTLDTLLDTLYLYDWKDKQFGIRKEFNPAWDKTPSDETFDDFYCNSKTSFTHVKLILFGAVISFVASFNKYEDFNIEDFRQWMRVVWNIIENTDIDSLTPVSSLIRKFYLLANHIKDNRENGYDFFSSLASYGLSDNENRAVVEEVRKAKLISGNIEWLPLFSEAERHPYLKGMVMFFGSENMTIDEYRHRLGIIQTMFDENGISPEYRKDHILIRSIVACHNSWDRINKLYVTERSEKNKHLKNILADTKKVEVQNLFATISSLSSESEIKGYLKDFIEKNEIECWPTDRKEDREDFSIASSRLLNDVKMYSWIAKEEIGYNASFRIYSYAGHVMFAIPRKQYAKMAIDTERAQVAKAICDKYLFEFDNSAQEQMIKDYGDCFGNECWIHLLRGEEKIQIVFCTWHEVIMRIECSSPEKALELKEKMDGSSIAENSENLLVLPKLRHSSKDSTLGKISEVIDKLFDIIPL